MRQIHQPPKKPKGKKKKRVSEGPVKPLYPARMAGRGGNGRTGVKSTTVGQSPDSRGTACGGSAVGVSGRPADHANAQVVLAGLDVPRLGTRAEAVAFEAGLVETADPADRAHDVRVGRFLLPAAVNGSPNRTLAARPRRYPPVHVNSAGLAIDSQFDDWHERKMRLLGVSYVGDTVGRHERDHTGLRFSAIALMGPAGARNLMERPCGHSFNSKLDKRASKILSDHGLSVNGWKGGNDGGPA